MEASSLDDDDFEVLAGDGHGSVARAVRAHDQRVQIVMELLLFLRIERGECLEERLLPGVVGETAGQAFTWFAKVMLLFCPVARLDVRTLQYW